MSSINPSEAERPSKRRNDERRRRLLVSMPTLVGEYTCLRELRDDDGDAIVRLLSDPRVTEYQLRRPPRTRPEVDDWISLMHHRRSEGTMLCFAITFIGVERLVGLCQLSAADGGGEVEWGWLLETGVWGSGVFQDVTRLLREFARVRFDVAALIARVHEDNRRAASALAKLGSTLRDASGSTTTWSTSTDVPPVATRRAIASPASARSR